MDEMEERDEQDAKKAQWIRRIVMVTVFGTAITLGYFVKLPVWSFGKDKKEQVNHKEKEREIREALAAENRLTVLNAMVDGNPDSEKLKKILEELKERKYGDQVEAVDLEVELQKTLADEHAIDLEKFAGQLDFYAGGEKLGTLKGETDPVVVERTIDRYLFDLLKRFGPNWLPKVEGMKHGHRGDHSQPPVAAPAGTPGVTKPQTRPSAVPGMESAGGGVPGMERTGGGVPGMRRAKPSQSNIKVEPADETKK